ncbi:MAG: hypothetical protein Greene07144_665, partial [Parcubacteria group bacterium Greene0714_4]
MILAAQPVRRRIILLVFLVSLENQKFRYEMTFRRGLYMTKNLFLYILIAIAMLSIIVSAVVKDNSVTVEDEKAIGVARDVVSEPAMPVPESIVPPPLSLKVEAAPPVSQKAPKKNISPVALAMPVAVVETKDPVCNQSNIMEQYSCYNEFYVELVKKSGSGEAMAYIKKKYNEGDGFYKSQCHQLVHMVGRAATDVYTTVSEAYTHGDSFCWSGYYHGVMEGIVSKIGSKVADKL